nr:hypothetical protein [Ramlibacter henchirensis]
MRTDKNVVYVESRSDYVVENLKSTSPQALQELAHSLLAFFAKPQCP